MITISRTESLMIPATNKWRRTVTIDNDDSWTYHRDYAISEAVSEYKEDKDNG